MLDKIKTYSFEVSDGEVVEVEDIDGEWINVRDLPDIVAIVVDETMERRVALVIGNSAYKSTCPDGKT